MLIILQFEVFSTILGSPNSGLLGSNEEMQECKRIGFWSQTPGGQTMSLFNVSLQYSSLTLYGSH